MTVENCGTYDVVISDDKIVVFKTIDELIEAFKSDREYMEKLKNKLVNNAKLLYSTFNNSLYKEEDIKEGCIGIDFNDECLLNVMYDDKEHIYVIYDKGMKVVAKLHYIIDELEDFRRIYSKYVLLNNKDEADKNSIDKFIPEHDLNDIVKEKEQFIISWNYEPLNNEKVNVYFNIMRKPDITQEDFYASQITDDTLYQTYTSLSDKFDNKSMAAKRRIELDIIVDKIKTVVNTFSTPE